MGPPHPLGQLSADGIRSLPYIGAAYYELIKNPSKLGNKQYHFTEINTTHQEITDILTKIHGKEPDLIQWDEEKLHTVLNDSAIALGAGLLRKSGQDGWVFPGERVVVPGWKGKSIEEWTKDAASRA